MESLDLNSQIFIQDSTINGFTDIKSGKGKWKGRQFDSGTVYGVLKNNSIIIENFHFQSDEDFCSFLVFLMVKMHTQSKEYN